jgi:hypothetical protein
MMEDHIWSSRKRGRTQEKGEKYFSAEEEALHNKFKLLTVFNCGRLVALRDNNIKAGEQLQFF